MTSFLYLKSNIFYIYDLSNFFLNNIYKCIVILFLETLGKAIIPGMIFHQSNSFRI